jgi:hypothetical protein
MRLYKFFIFLTIFVSNINVILAFSALRYVILQYILTMEGINPKYHKNIGSIAAELKKIL